MSRYGDVVRSRNDVLAGLAAIQGRMPMHAGPESHRDNPELKSKGSGSTSTDRRVPPGRGRQVAPTPMSKRDGKRSVAPQTVIGPEGTMYEGMQAPGVRFMANDQMPYIVQSGDTLTSIVQNAPHRPNRTNLLQSLLNWATPEEMFPDSLRFEGNPISLDQALYEIRQMNDLDRFLQRSQRLNLPQGMGHNIWGKPTRG